MQKRELHAYFRGSKPPQRHQTVGKGMKGVLGLCLVFGFIGFSHGLVLGLRVRILIFVLGVS